MDKIQTKKISLRINERVRGNAKIYAKNMGVSLGEFIIMALKSLSLQREKTWVNSLPKGWLSKHKRKSKRKSTSVNFPISEIEFIDSMKNKSSDTFEAIVEMAIFNRMPSLRRYARKRSKLKTTLYKCTNINCGHQEERKKGSGKFRCVKCKKYMLPKTIAGRSYYESKLNKLLKFIQFGSTKVPDISDIDAEIVKRFFIKKMIKTEKNIKSCKRKPKKIEFTPIIGNVYPKWSKRNKVVIAYKNETAIGTVYDIDDDIVYVTFERQKELTIIRNKEDNEDYNDEFAIESKTTIDGKGRLIGRVI